MFLVVELADRDLPELGIISAIGRDRSVGTDDIIHTPVFKMSGQRLIVGLSRVQTSKIWVVPALEPGEFWFIDWDIYFI